MTFQTIVQFFGVLVSQKFTGKVTFNIHEGNVSKKVHKEIVEVIE